MKKYGYKIICCTGLFFLLSSCISVFEPVGVKDLAGILVVDGMILETGTIVRLRRTVKTSDDLSKIKFDDLNNASIHVIDEGNNVITVAEQQIINGIINPGVYVVNHDISFSPEMKYALDMQIAGKHYQSAFVSPVHTPEIDEVSYKINDDGSIDLFVSTHDPTNQTNYFRWAFDEEWEIRSKLFQNPRYDPNTETLIPQSIYGNNTYYCWASDYSKSLLVASSTQFTDAVIKNHKIHSLRPGTTRYSYLYSILVRQYGLEQEAYLYFENLQKNLDESGSIFAPQPSEKTGNIQCLSNPEETVIGYILASKATTYRIFIPMAQLQLNSFEDNFDCTYNGFPPSDHKDAYSRGLGSNGNAWVFLRCVDCTLRGGTKIKPDFWPNDHQ